MVLKHSSHYKAFIPYSLSKCLSLSLTIYILLKTVCNISLFWLFPLQFYHTWTPFIDSQRYTKILLISERISELPLTCSQVCRRRWILSWQMFCLLSCFYSYKEKGFFLPLLMCPKPWNVGTLCVSVTMTLEPLNQHILTIGICWCKLLLLCCFLFR